MSIALYCLCYVAGHHSPHKAGEFPCDSCFCNIGSLVVFKDHAIVFSPQPLVCFIGKGDDFRSVPILPGLECLGLETDLPMAVALCCLYQQTAYMPVSGLGYAQSIQITSTGILAGGKANVGGKVLCGADEKRLKSPTSVSTANAVTVLTPIKQDSLWTFS